MFIHEGAHHEGVQTEDAIGFLRSGDGVAEVGEVGGEMDGGNEAGGGGEGQSTMRVVVRRRG